jgi:hypothetical protein
MKSLEEPRWEDCLTNVAAAAAAKSAAAGLDCRISRLNMFTGLTA